MRGSNQMRYVNLRFTYILTLHHSNLLSVESTQFAESTQVLTQTSGPMHSMFSHYVTV